MTDAANSGAAGIVEALDRLGVGVAFGLPGIHNLAIWEARGPGRGGPRFQALSR